jgi:FkbM family methyltransferase
MSLLRDVLYVKPINRVVRSLGRALLPAESFRRFDRRLPLIDPFDLTLPNSAIIHWLPQGDAVSKFLRYDGWDGYEGPSVRLFYELARHAEVVFDVGAYVGYFALLGAAARSGNRAFAFEAVPALAEKCKRLAERNPALSMDVVAAAVSRSDGRINLYVGDGTASDTSTDPTFRPNRPSVSVESITLDRFMADRKLDRVDLLKIDTESTEPDVLAGMGETVHRSRPTMLIEVLNIARVDELEAFLRQHDYACASVAADGLHARQRVEPDMTGENPNYLFYPRQPDNPVAAAAHKLLT